MHRKDKTTLARSFFCLSPDPQLTCALFLARRASTLESGPMPAYASPALGVTGDSFLSVDASISGDRAFFSVASTTPSTARMPRAVAPAETALRACSIWCGVRGRGGWGG